MSKGPITSNYCSRFVGSYCEFPPGCEHRTIVICNGGKLPISTELIFAPIDHDFLRRENDQGFDLSGYVDAARGEASDCDAMLCLGESVYFHKEGWLKRLIVAWEQHGPGMYGPFASHNVRAHLNTTAFMCPPAMLLSYPVSVWTRALRYEFEHGTNSMWRRAHSQNIPVMLVTWDGEWPPGKWRVPKDILWRGTQTNLLMFCNHTERWHNAIKRQKDSWSAKADQRFQ